MSKRPYRPKVGVPPPEHRPGRPPPARPIAQRPDHDPLEDTPLHSPTRAPRQRPVGKVPNPRKPKLVRDVGGGYMQDLFATFPDLPRPVYKPKRVPIRRKGPRGPPQRPG